MILFRWNPRHMTEKNWIIGVTGGIASGKSTLIDMADDLLKARVVDADQMVHTLLDTRDIQEQIRARIGDHVLSDEGVDREALAADVFENPDRLETLHDILHPPVLARIRKEIATFRQQRVPPVLLLDVPLLVEKDLDQVCDIVLFADAPDGTRLERARTGRGWSEQQFRAREERQADLSLKRERSDFTISTGNTKESTRSELRELLAEQLPSHVFQAE